jgi:hypothetical protein
LAGQFEYELRFIRFPLSASFGRNYVAITKTVLADCVQGSGRLGHDRGLCLITKRSQFEYTFCRLNLRAVDCTAASNANLQLRAGDATAISLA